MVTYTKEDIEKWFDWMVKKYPNCNFQQSLIAVRDAMFGDFWESNNIDSYLKKGEH